MIKRKLPPSPNELKKWIERFRAWRRPVIYQWKPEEIVELDYVV